MTPCSVFMARSVWVEFLEAKLKAIIFLDPMAALPVDFFWILWAEINQIYDRCQRGDGSEAKTGKDIKIFWFQTQGPGRLAQTPRSCTDDSACRSGRYWCSIVLIWAHLCQGNLPIFFFCCFAATQLARQLHQEHTKVCSNREARKRPALRHSDNGPWT